MRPGRGWVILFPGNRRKDLLPEVRERTGQVGEQLMEMARPLRASFRHPGCDGCLPPAWHPWVTPALPLPFLGHMAATPQAPKALTSLSPTNVPQSKPVRGAY